MQIDIPSIKCSVAIEQSNSNGSIANKCSYNDVSITLGRNGQGDCVLQLVDNRKQKSVKSYVFVKNRENYKLNTKFVSEGKCSITLTDLSHRLFIYNCPPNDLSVFLKGLSLKCNYYNSTTTKGTATNNHVLSLKRAHCTSIVEKISPITTKDLQRNLKFRDLTNLATSSTTPLKADSKTKTIDPKKRKLELTFDNLKNGSPGTKRKIMKAIIPSPVRSLKILNAHTLTDEQHRVLSAVLHGQSLFFTGSAGTGKSYLLKFIINRMPPKSTYVTASTGIAACHIGGITLHMFSGVAANWLEPIKVNDIVRKLTPQEIVERLMKNMTKVQRWRGCKCLIIDEISMVSGEYFQMLDQIGRILRKDNRPFGGIQVVVSGDFLQLPPISRKDKVQLSFQSKAWSELITNYFELRKVKRQTDPTFIRLLQQLRVGRITDSIKETLLKTTTNNLRLNGNIPTQLYTHRKDVDLVNDIQLNKLTAKLVMFHADDSDQRQSILLDSMCPTPRRLELKEGAQVMLNKNLDVNNGLVNGLTGVVVRFENVKSSNFLLPHVRFMNGVEKTIEIEKWMVNMGDGARPICRRHLPLQLAWALSVHKSQGMTISSGVEISLAKVFESGQAYVAMSRATSLENIKILDFRTQNILVNEDALNFYKQLKYCT